MRIVVLAGGIGGARFLAGVRAWAGRRDGAEVTAVVNVGDDVTLHGLRICPDLDSVMYTLGGGADPERGWGRVGETWTVKEELAAYGAEPTWFGLGDKDVATHLVRTRMLDAGYPLSAVTEALCARWQPGVRLLPASDDRVETHVVVPASAEGPERAIHFQEWWVRHRGALPAQRFVFVGADTAKAGAGVLEALAEADVVLLAPSNPVVSIAPILAVAPAPGGRGGWPGPGGRRVADHRRRAGARDGRQVPGRARGPVHGGRGRRALRCPDRRRGARRVAGRSGGRRDQRVRGTGAQCSTVDDGCGRDRGDGGGGDRRGGCAVTRDGIAVLPVHGIGEVVPGTDLAAVITTAAPWLRDGDVLVVTSKIVSKAEGRLVDVPAGGPEREQARDEIAGGRDRADGGPARTHPHRADPSRLRDGQRRHRRVQCGPLAAGAAAEGSGRVGPEPARGAAGAVRPRRRR